MERKHFALCLGNRAKAAATVRRAELVRRQTGIRPGLITEIDILRSDLLANVLLADQGIEFVDVLGEQIYQTWIE